MDRSEPAEMLLQGEELGSPTGVVATPELLQWLRISIPGRRRPTINSAAIVDSPSAHQTLESPRAGGQSECSSDPGISTPSSADIPLGPSYHA